MTGSGPQIRGTGGAEILVAACEGSVRLSCAVGLPIVLIDAVDDARSALAVLDATAHASGVRVDVPVAPIVPTSGWDRWRRFPLDEGATAGRAPGVSMRRGRLVVSLPRGVPLSEFREQLHAGLRHLRLQDVASGVGYIRQRSSAAVHRAVHPRYTPSRRPPGIELVTDLYCLDPTCQAWRLFWIVAAARLAVTDPRRTRWR